MTDLRLQITAALKDFETYPLPEAATRLFATLGYAHEHPECEPHGRPRRRRRLQVSPT